MEYRKQAHCTYRAEYHMVFVTKYRRDVLKGGMGRYLEAVLAAASRRYPEIDILEMNTDVDHVHILASVPPRMAVSEAVRILKSRSGRAMRRKFPFLGRMYERENLGLWSDGYFVSTVGCDSRTIERYIRAQGQEDKGQAKLVL